MLQPAYANAVTLGQLGDSNPCCGIESAFFLQVSITDVEQLMEDTAEAKAYQVGDAARVELEPPSDPPFQPQLLTDHQVARADESKDLLPLTLLTQTGQDCVSPEHVLGGGRRRGQPEGAGGLGGFSCVGRGCGAARSSHSMRAMAACSNPQEFFLGAQRETLRAAELDPQEKKSRSLSVCLLACFPQTLKSQPLQLRVLGFKG
jgi:hypothetical protein